MGAWVEIRGELMREKGREKLLTAEMGFPVMGFGWDSLSPVVVGGWVPFCVICYQQHLCFWFCDV